MMIKNRKISITLLALLITITTQALAESADIELAKKSQNPVGDIISLPFEYNMNFNVGPEDATVHTIDFKPIYPVRVGKYNLINRFILPMVHQGERFPGEGTETGLGDLTYQAFFSPAAPSKIIWGFGPVVTLPTHTDNRLGSDKVSGGPALLVLTKPGRWLVGALAQQFWSFAGASDAPDVSLMTIQYFVNYNLDDGWYLTTSPTITADWESNGSERFTVPFGGGVGRLVRFDKMPVDFKLASYVNVGAPDNASDWKIQFQVKFLFPK